MSDRGGIDATDEVISKFQDLAIVRLRRSGLSWRRIGKALRLSHEGARKRYRQLPVAVRDHYGRAEAV